LERGQTLVTTDLLERDTELAVISAAVTAAVHARAGGVLLIEGPAGIGKTSLLEAAAEMAAGLGAAVSQARGGELERNFPFGVARQLLEARVAALPAAERGRVLGGAAQAAAPIVDPRAAARPLPGGGMAADERAFIVSHGLYWLMCNLADAVPLFVGVDDGQWCDAGSARFLSYLARRLEELPLLLVVAARSGEPGGDVMGAALGDRHTQVLRPRPLSVAAASELVRRKLASGAGEDFCRECCRVSGGNPFLLRALLEELVAERITPGRRRASGRRATAGGCPLAACPAGAPWPRRELPGARGSGTRHRRAPGGGHARPGRPCCRGAGRRCTGRGRRARPAAAS
jgi:hypothetical protein